MIQLEHVVVYVCEKKTCLPVQAKKSHRSESLYTRDPTNSQKRWFTCHILGLYACLVRPNSQAVHVRDGQATALAPFLWVSRPPNLSQFIIQVTALWVCLMNRGVNTVLPKCSLSYAENPALSSVQGIVIFGFLWPPSRTLSTVNSHYSAI